eukprot:TRINITY_DN452_c0_g4_i1.p1 TRINITY_DN452_c0_g4~~TRINITY_DN452_c0_g4_i1.p1  ORF type:complete len:671 (+),score=149.92 TRINITY_DN452_c0_g4_i1:256-2268(+)
MTIVLALTLLLSLTLIENSSQQTQGEVVLDPEGKSVEEFQGQIQVLTQSTFSRLASATQGNVQDVITDFSTDLSLNIANVVIFLNNQGGGIEDVDESGQQVSAALQSGMNSVIASSHDIFKSFPSTELKSIVEKSVSGVLQELQEGKGINDVINSLASNIAKTSFQTVQEFITDLQKDQEAVSDDINSHVYFDQASEINTNDVYFDEASDDTLLSPVAEVGGDIDVSEDVDEKDIVISDGFVFIGSGRTVQDLKQQILLLSETGFAMIENSVDPYKPAYDFALNVTQVVGEVLLTVLDAEDNVDKETEAEAISDAVGSALSVGVADSMGPLQMLDIDYIQNQIVAATFNAITASAEPKVDVDPILQKAAKNIMETMVTALNQALNFEFPKEEDNKQQKDAIMQKTKDNPENDTIAIAPSPSVAGVSADTVVTDKMAQTQESLTAALKGSFLQIESDPTSSDNGAAVNDMLMAIGQATGETMLAFKTSSNPQEITQVIISLFFNALQQAVSQSSHEISNFDVNGVVKLIGNGVSEALTESQDADLSRQVQQVAGVVINIIIEELQEVVAGFDFGGNIVVVSEDDSEDSNIVEKSASVADPRMVKDASGDNEPPPQNIAIDKAPLSPLPTSNHTELPKEGNCLCFDEELFDAMVSARVQEEVILILQKNNLI